MLISGINVFASKGEVYVYRNNTFDYNLVPEPMNVTDEDFFGKWDNVNRLWVEQPDFNYEKFPGLADVEKAAKNGDYKAAKEALMAYYVPQKNDKIGKSYSSATAIQESEMAARNVYASRQTGTPIGFVPGATTQWKELSTTDVLSFVTTSVSQNNPYVTFVVASVDKSNSPAEIKSRTTDAPPTLTLKVDGVTKTFVACEDSYISPTVNANKNYGNEDVLYAQEYGYTSHWSDPTAPWGEQAGATRRTYIKFDISDVAKSSNVTSASFNFTTRVVPGGDLSEKEFFIYGWKDSTWDEMSLTWNTYTDWLFFSTNEQECWTYRMSDKTTSKGKMCYYHRGSQPAYLATMYGATGDEKYAHNFIRQMTSLLYYVGVNKSYMNALDMSNHIAHIGDAFIKCWGSEYMSAEYFTAFLKHFSRMTDFIIVNYLDKDSHWNNWASNQTGSTYWACMKFPEFAQADYWYEKTLFHNKKLYNVFVYDDGVCIEQGLGYIETILGTINRAINVYNEFSVNPPYGIFMDEDGANVILNIVKNMYYSLAPGYGGFDLSDSMDYNQSYKSDITSWYKKLVKLGIDDPELQYVATDGKKGVLPKFTSISFPYGMRTYMRTDWSADAIAMAITAKGDGASHRHNDNLSLSMYAYGQYLLIDSSYGAVLTGDIRKYMIDPQRHNTLTINKGSQTGGSGQDSVTKEVEISDNYNYVTYSNAYFNNASNVERTVMFPKDNKFFIVTDYVVPSNQSKLNTVEQYWHMLPNSGIYISDDGKNEFRSNFESGANVIVSPVDGSSYKTVTLEDSLYAPASGTFIEKKNGMYVKETYGPTSLGTVIYPLEEGEDKIIETTPIDTGIADDGAVAFKITITDSVTDNVETYYYYHLNDISMKKKVTIGGYKTNATTLFVKEDSTGDIDSLFVYDAYYVEKNGKVLYSSNVWHTLGIDYTAKGQVNIYAENLREKDLEGIAVYIKNSENTVTLNGAEVDGNKNGSSVVFGEMGVVNPDENSGVDIVKWDHTSPIGTGGNISVSAISSIYKKTSNSASFSAMGSYSNYGRVATINTDTDGTKYISTEYGGYKHNAYKKDSSGKYISGGDLYSHLKSINGDVVEDSETPVLSFKTNMRIPKGANQETERLVVLSFFEGQQINMYLKQFEDENGRKYSGASIVYNGKVTNKKSVPYEYEVGEWVTLEARVYVKPDGTLLIGGYADGNQIYYAESTDSLYKDTMQVNSVELYNGKTSPVATDYKEISVSAIDELFVPVNEIFENENKIIYFPFNNVSYTTPSVMANIANSVGDSISVLKIDKNSSLSGKESYTTVDSSVASKDIRSLFVSTNADGSTDNYLRLFQDSQKSLKSYMDMTSETVFKLSYDVYIPSKSLASVRSTSLKLTTDSTDYSNSNFIIDSVIDNGKITFGINNSSSLAEAVPLTMRTQEADITSDSWHTVEYILKLTPTASGYTMKVYGILDNISYYENEYKFKTDNIIVSYFPEIRIFGTGSGLNNIKTGFDNISFSQLFNYTEDLFECGFTDEKYVYPVYVGYENSIVRARARMVGYNDNACLVLAIYSADDRLLKTYVSTTFDGEYMSCASSIDEIIIRKNYKAKAFLLDSLESAIPYVENAGIVIE